MEKQFDWVKLHFTSPLHISRGRATYDESKKILHSDTLAAALFVGSLQVGADEKEALAMLDGCRLSSAFPYCHDEFFFPKPHTSLPFSLKEVSEDKRGKPFKKIRYLGKSWFEKMLHGEEAEIDSHQHLFEKEFLSSKKLPVVYKTEVIQRVTIPPDYSDDATPFYTERLFFGQDSGLFVLVEWKDTNVKDLFFRAFRLLGDLGVGTDRSVGNGFFIPELGSLALQVPETASHQCSLGLFLPAENELSDQDLEQSSWSLTKRGGYLAGAADVEHITLRKRSIFMFEEGSVFPNKLLEGKREDLKPDWPRLHPVWREGRPMFLPIYYDPRIE